MSQPNITGGSNDPPMIIARSVEVDDSSLGAELQNTMQVASSSVATAAWAAGCPGTSQPRISPIAATSKAAKVHVSGTIPDSIAAAACAPGIASDGAHSRTRIAAKVAPQTYTESSCTLHFAGCDAIASIHPRLRLDVAHLVGQRVGVHRPVVDGHPAVVVEPGERVLHPVLVVAVGEILARMRAAALGAVRRRLHGDDRLGDEIVELQRLHQVGIPDQRPVGDADVG